ncbi:O-methyltransferase [Pseudoalteromonas luteoviolacea]|uniref:O-methyltransferase n=1 Tax=Pseudoalteromonas luteoviolacea TaxID=43657 RepID=UPI001B35CC7B|nr:O-methyltransferase [Pseudoalteromonas luteoviolacea]MBQ4812723.1 O-methyltransferase [Pseudoalteromonas luteoviolacea]
MLNNHLTQLLSDLAKLGEENDAKAANKQSKYLNITHDTGEFLAFLIKASKTRRILELGTSNGYSTLWMASALPLNGHITTIEGHEHKYLQARNNFDKANLDVQIHSVLGDISTTLKQLEARYDLVFFDADRTIYMDIIADIEQLLVPGGVIVCDNATSHPQELKDFMHYLSQSPLYTTALVPVGKGEFVAYKAS